MTTIHRAIGIDLGTTNSVMAMMRGGEPKVILNGLGEALTPSAVSIGRRGELLVGKAAKNRTGEKNTILSIKRFMGLPYELVLDDVRRVSFEVGEGPGGEVRILFNSRAYSPTEISAMILHRLRQDAQERLGEPVGRAVITVPAYFNDAQVAATRDAGRMAGFTVLRIVREPTAAALAFGLDRGFENGDTASVLVYDLGGGTFDISILMMVQGIFQVLGIEGDKHLGGDDFDFEIMKYIYQRATAGKDLEADPALRRSLKLKAEEAKKELSNIDPVEINIAAVAGIDIEDEIERSEFNRMITPWIDRTVQLMQKAMREASMTPDLIDHILLVGGSTLIPYVRQVLVAEFGEKKIRRNVDPMQCVALGAAIQSSLIDQIDCPNPDCRDENGLQTKNPVDATECYRCKTSLIGYDVVTCPVCFVPTDASKPKCHKCKSDLAVQPGVAPGPARPPAQPQFWKCLECEYPKNPPAAAECQICGKPREAGGVRCLKCGHPNKAGATACASCGEPIGGVFEAIPESLGIELQDGRMAVLIPKNTGYPTTKAHSKDFYTPEANQKQLDVLVRQGPAERAADNEYCGAVVLDLPPGLPKGATVTISLGLDQDGTIVATVQLRDFPNRRATARIVRGGIGSPAVRQRRDELVERAETALKDGQDLEGAATLQARVVEIKDRGMNVSNEELDEFEREVRIFEELVQEQASIQSALREVEMMLAVAKEYLASSDVEELERRANSIRQALARGRREEAQRHAHELEAFLETRGLYRLLTYLEVVRKGGMISAGLANRIGAGLRNLKAARNQAEFDACLQELMACWEQVGEELKDKRPGRGKPVDTQH